MLRIIGLDHSVQTRSPGSTLNEGQQAFASCLQKTIKEVQPVLIAEEHSEAVLKELGKVSIAKEIAGECIEHRFCDPTPKQRKVLGYKGSRDIEIEMSMQSKWDGTERRRDACAIEIGRYFPIRERFWLNCLNVKQCRSNEVIFVCGALHIESHSFTKLLEENAIPYTVVERYIGVAQDEPYYLALEYLKKHPEVLDAPF